MSTAEKFLAACESMFLLNLATAIKVRRAKKLNQLSVLRDTQENLNRTGDVRRATRFFTAVGVVLIGGILLHIPAGTVALAAVLYYAAQVIPHAYASLAIGSALEQADEEHVKILRKSSWFDFFS